MNIPTYNSLEKYADADDSFYDIFEYLTSLPWLCLIDSVWLGAMILSLLEKSKEQGRKARISMKTPDGFTLYDFDPKSLSFEVLHSENNDDRGDFLVSDDIDSVLVVDYWKNCDYHNQTPPDLEIIDGGIED